MSEYEEEFDEGSSSASAASSVASSGSPGRSAPVATPIAAVPVAVPVPQPVASVSATSDDADPVAAALARGEWRSHTDGTTGKVYYYNTQTKKTTWDLAAELRAAAAVPLSSTASPAQRSGGSPASSGSKSADASSHSDSTVVSRPFAASSSLGEEARADSHRGTVVSEVAETDSASMSAASGVVATRRRAAKTAEERSEYQMLSNFVAFGSSASPSAPRSSSATAFTGVDAPPAASPEPEPNARRRAAASPPPKALFSSTQKPQESTESDRHLETLTSTNTRDGGVTRETEKESAVEDPSSVFSTLSQHLKQPAAKPAPAAAATAAEEDTTRGVISRDSRDDDDGHLAVGAAAAAAAAASDRDQPRGATAADEAVPQVRITMPALPSPSFMSPTMEPSSPVVGGYPARGGQAPLRLDAPLLGSVPPPLPLPTNGGLFAQSQAVPTVVAAPPVDPKLLELRETSEAVERLVRAFATLRGHGVGDGPAAGRTAGRAALSPESTARETLDATTMHRVGAASTVRQTTDHHTARDAAQWLRSSVAVAHRKGRGDDEAAAARANEQLVEEVVMSCVLEMMQRDAGKARRTQQIVDRVKMQPHHVTVSADDFRPGSGGGSYKPPRSPEGPAALPSGNAGARAFRGASALSVFDNELRAFDPAGPDGAGEAEALFQSVESNLRRYVLSHVVDPTRPQPQEPPGPSPGGGALPTPVTAHFAWILLMDLLAVCLDILERHFVPTGGPDAATIPADPVVVRYEGERHCELLARNAIHCLPFELVDASSGDGGSTGSDPHSQQQHSESRRRPLFRMEFWVTRAALVTVVEAISSTIRQHIAHTASSAPYAIFATDINPHVNARVLSPSKVPFFSVVMDGRRRVPSRGHGGPAVPLAGEYRAKPAARHEGARGAAGVDGEGDFFGVPQANVQSMAHIVSSIATGLLEKAPSNERRPQRRPGAAAGVAELNALSYDDLTVAVADTVQELLSDEGIRAAVERRSLEKFEAAQKAKREYPSKTRLEKERVVIAKAEKEADDLVKRINEEMLRMAVGA